MVPDSGTPADPATGTAVSAIFTEWLACQSMGNPGLAFGLMSDDYRRLIAANDDVARIVAGEPGDIGPMIAALLSGDNRRVNAQGIEVSGGMNI